MFFFGHSHIFGWKFPMFSLEISPWEIPVVILQTWLDPRGFHCLPDLGERGAEGNQWYH